MKMGLMKINSITLAAGNGTRMKSSIAKPLHEIGNLSLLRHSMGCFSELNLAKKILVASEDLLLQDREIEKDFTVVIQKEKLGTGHAIMCCKNELESDSICIINYADTPFVKKETILKMLDAIKTCDCVFLGFKTSDVSNKYGRLIVKNDELLDIIEYKDASDEIRKQDLCNSGIIAIKSNVLRDNIDKITNNNASGEFYLTDIVKIIGKGGFKSKFVMCEEDEVMGVNSRLDLANAEKYFQKMMQKYHMENGVTLQNPDSIYFSHDTKIANDVTLEPNVYFSEGVEIDSGCCILASSYLSDVTIGKNCTVGPFARIRGVSEIGDNSIVGNFVEIKNTKLKNDVKAKHLTYLGDVEIDKNTNIGAGTIFANYDGFSKFSSKIGKNVSIGINSSLISPIEIGDGAIIAAGSIIVKNIEENSIAIARAEQRNIANAAERYRQKRKKK